MRAKETADRIRSMEIRGAAEIARQAALALKDEALAYQGKDAAGLFHALDEARQTLVASRPTAISLWNGVQFVMKGNDRETDLDLLRTITVRRADEFVKRSKEALDIIARIGANRIPDGAKVLTHCNSKAAIGCLIAAHRQGKNIQVFATESRPWRQGILTVNDLAKAGVPTTLIIDSAVRHIMKDLDAVFVGADTIASNGAVINKIGTSQVALAADESRVPFYVCAETFKFSPKTMFGELVKIEERGSSEIVKPGEIPDSVKIFNPVFDATPPEYIDSIITELGVVPPYAAYEIIVKEFGQEYIFTE
ncbi:MAG: Ribose 1,5-bisphosphate isomerase [Methanomassiliicoccales archaeon PtaU1.Bin124]|nr:MAG: Ribose 1,5-bisphosphate isomerase [Methanomassiliicoccales archaeon PtaU1.Bin124]